MGEVQKNGDGDKKSPKDRVGDGKSQTGWVWLRDECKTMNSLLESPEGWSQ